MKDSEELDKLIIEKCKTSTFGDIVSELGITQTQLVRRLKDLGVKPIRGKERNCNFIMANYQTMNGQEIADKLSLELYTLIHYYEKALNISFILTEEQKHRMWQEHNAKRVGYRFGAMMKPTTTKQTATPDQPATQPTKPAPKGKSVGAILSEFRLDNAQHYFEHTDPIEQERLKLRRDLEKLNITFKK